MLSRIFNFRDRGPALLSDGQKASIAAERADFAQASRQTVIEHQAARVALLKAGGAELAHQPGYQDPWEIAIRRLVQSGELREVIEYASFPHTRKYTYVLTPTGEQAAAAILDERPEARSD